MKTDLGSYKERFEKLLAKTLEHYPVKLSPVWDAVVYAVCAGGKRVRPALAYLGAEIAGGRAEDVYKTLPMAKNKRTVFARKSGRLQVFALALGRACAALGGGRTHEGGEIDHAAGILLKKRQGAYVKEGEPLAEIYSSADVEEGAALAESAFGISEKKIKDRPLVYAFIGGKEQSSV